jgi:hypothetical protein
MAIHFQQVKDVAEFLSYVAVVLGVPLALLQFRDAVRKEQEDRQQRNRAIEKERQDREYATYDALDDKYLEFQKLCFDHPHLDISDVPDKDPAPLTEAQKKQQIIAFSMLFSMFERARIMYLDQSADVKKRQWTGWEEYIGNYLRRTNFREAWEIYGTQYDSRFQEYMAGRLKEMRSASPPQQA